MMREHFGEGAETMRLISPGTRFNTGDGSRLTPRTSHTTINGGRVGRRSFIPRSASSLPSSVQHP
jgi:tricarballylate dehydrogenase